MPVIHRAAAERRSQHHGGQQGGGDPSGDHRGREQPLPWQVAARNEQPQAESGDQQAHVLLDQQQGGRSEQRRPQPAGLHALEERRGERGHERNLVEAEGGRLGHRPAQRVCASGEVPGRRSDTGGRVARGEPAREHPDQGNGGRERDALYNQERLRAVVEPVERAQGRDDG